jgi:Probable zinc-ribbon domain
MGKRKGKPRHDGSDKYKETRIPADTSQQAPNNSYSPPLFYEDTPFTCVDCGKEEIWTATQQKWWYEVAKGEIYSRAVRCRECRRVLREPKTQ